MKAATEKLRSLAEALGCCSDFPRIIQTIGHELTINSLAYAPQANAGPGADQVEIHFGLNDEYVWIAVTDPYGTLTRERVLEALGRCAESEMCSVDMDSPSAGIGLFMVYNWSSELVFGIDEGKGTTVVSRIRKAKRYKEIGLQRASVHIVTSN
jgi:hypothetical protein